MKQLYSRKRRLPTVVCGYLSFRDPRLKTTFRLPLVHIRLRLGDNSVRTDALVDSGATTTFIPIELIEILGHEFKTDEKSEPSVGASGVFQTYQLEIDTIEVLKGTTPFCELKNYKVLIPTMPDALPHVVLGRDGIFWKYDITYREHKEQIVFRRPKH